MDKLPNEMLVEILIRLPVEQILICKQVNKKWYSLIKVNIKIKSLIITDYYYQSIMDKWFDSSEFVYDSNYQITNKATETINFRSDQTIFNGLKKLYISFKTISISSINCLEQLEVLEIKNSNLKSKNSEILNDQKELKLNLNFLRSLCLNEISTKLVIDCPKLEKLKISIYEKVRFIHTENIKEFYGKVNRNLVRSFVNLKHLYTSFAIDESILAIYKSLAPISYADYHKLELCHLLVLKRLEEDLKDSTIYYLGANLATVSYEDFKYLSKYLWDTDKFCLDNVTIQFCFQNGSNLSDSIYFIRNVNYNSVENYLNQIDQEDQRPNELIKKLVNLEELTLTDQINDLEQFTDLLKELRYLNRLIIEANFMDQHFFDQILSEYCSVIGTLIIKNKNQLNFDFLFKFKNLQTFKTDQQFTIDMLVKMFKKFELLNFVSFYLKGSKVEIKFHNRCTFKLILDGIKKSFDNFDDLRLDLESNHKPINHKDEEDVCLDNFMFNDDL